MQIVIVGTAVCCTGKYTVQACYYKYEYSVLCMCFLSARLNYIGNNNNVHGQQSCRIPTRYCSDFKEEKGAISFIWTIDDRTDRIESNS